MPSKAAEIVLGCSELVEKIVTHLTRWEAVAVWLARFSECFLTMTFDTFQRICAKESFTAQGCKNIKVLSASIWAASDLASAALDDQ